MASVSGLFNEEMARAYDERNSKLAPITEAMHFLIRLLLQELPARARVLCVGVGTGAEILSLAGAWPTWTFVGVDPSAPMLEVCRERLTAAGVIGRCELVHGDVRDAPAGESFDAALSVLVAHFVKREDRVEFYRQLQQRVRPGGYVVSTELSFDLESAGFPSMLAHWERVQALMGATPESLRSLPDTLREALCVLPPSETESLMRAGGIALPVRFFQALMVAGWYGRKNGA